MILCNVSNYVLSDSVSHPRRILSNTVARTVSHRLHLNNTSTWLLLIFVWIHHVPDLDWCVWSPQSRFASLLPCHLAASQYGCWSLYLQFAMDHPSHTSCKTKVHVHITSVVNRYLVWTVIMSVCVCVCERERKRYGSCSLRSLSVWDLGKFKCLIFVAKCTTVCWHCWSTCFIGGLCMVMLQLQGKQKWWWTKKGDTNVAFIMRGEVMNACRILFGKHQGIPGHGSEEEVKMCWRYRLWTGLFWLWGGRHGNL